MSGGPGRHLALFVPSLGGGGAERVMLILAGAFAARGHRVDLVLAKAQGALRDQVPDGVRIVDLAARRVLTSVPGLARYLRRERPDALLSAMNHANVAALVAARVSRAATRVVVSEHSTLSISVRQADVRRARLLPWLARRCYPSAHAVIAVSGGVADDLAATLGLARERIRVIHNPVVTAELLSRAREQPDHPWFRAGEAPVLLGVGRLTAAKDFTTLIGAFARLRQTRPVRLLLLGEGPERQRLQAQAEAVGVAQDLDMPGFVDNPFAYMRRAAVFVLSSRWEGLANVLIEALACGCPVVSTNCPSGPAEILEGGRYGRLVEVGDVAGLATAMASALEAPRPAEGVGRARDFGVEVAADQYLEVLIDAGQQNAEAGTW